MVGFSCRRKPRGDGMPVGIDIDSFASKIADLTRLEVQGPVFGMARVTDPERRVG